MAVATKIPYFTLKKAQSLVRVNPKNLTDKQLQDAYVKTRDYIRYIDSGDMKRLAEGGYFVSAITEGSIGVKPKDMWLRQNLGTTLDELTAERNKRMSKPQPKAKEPWQMTKEEFYKAWDEMSGGKAPEASQKEYDKLRDIWRRSYVERAVNQGKPVPSEVLKDYPELGETEETIGERAKRVGAIRQTKEYLDIKEQWQKIQEEKGAGSKEAIALRDKLVKLEEKPVLKPKKERHRGISMFTTKPAKQSNRALAIDRSLLARNVVSVDDPRWLKHPNRFDVRGIDTPGSGRIVPGVAYADKGSRRLSRRKHRGWKRIKLT